MKKAFERGRKGLLVVVWDRRRLVGSETEWKGGSG